MGILGAVSAVGIATTAWQVGANADLRSEVAALRAATRMVVAGESERERLEQRVKDLEKQGAEDAELIRLMDEESGLKSTVLEAMRARSVEREVATERLLQRIVCSASELDRAPIVHFQPSPIYPFEKRMMGVGGEVLVAFVVNRNGVVQDVTAKMSTGPEFEAAAVEAVKKWRFDPGQIGATAVNTRMQVPIVFQIAEDP